MKVAVLANRKHSFVRPLAEGFARMSESCGVSCEIHYDGLETISLPLGLRGWTLRELAGFILKSPQYRKSFDELVDRLRDADVIVVVAHVPASLSRNTLQNVELLRGRLPNIPIVNYDLIYLPTVEKWGAAMLRGDFGDISEDEARLITPRPFGMERYDWYLVASVSSEVPMPSGPHPCSRIGMDIDDGTLYPDQRGVFRVLVDFEQSRKDYPSFRAIQMEALERSGIPYTVLDGQYTRSEIREIYRTTGAFMLAHRESFGVPICELQASGSMIFTPRAEWAGAHWLKDDATMAGPGEHSANIVVYENNAESLIEKLRDVQRACDPERVVRVFMESHPQLFRGDRSVLAEFFDSVASGVIHSKLHLAHSGVGR